MSLQIVSNFDHSAVPFETSGDGALQRARDWVVRIGGALTIQGTTIAEIQSSWTRELATAEQTNSGLVPINVKTAPSTAIAELRRRSGLTWDQLARLFGVARRSVHFWASGKAMNAANEERLARMLAVVRYIDRGNAQATRAALMTAMSDGVIPFDLLAKDQFDKVMERLGACPQRSMPVLGPLSAAARATRMPPPPDERVGALHESVHHEVGKSRVARTVKVKNKR
ncbi:MAG: helix-turn-helix transcriptional regulator [Pseudomonadota bacterium]